MDIPREQFDHLLGGKEVLPSTVSIIKFANARSQEIHALTEALEDPLNTHRIFQRLPRHLRRRAMSHKVQRMPRRLRDAHLREMEKSGMPVKKKRPRRKYRRRPSNLLQEYNRRQRFDVWLETHIWHAKRFHMVTRWGYKIPHFPNEKGFRACYRATRRHCLIQDLSYLNCIELQGSEANIIQGLSQLTSPECGLTFAAKSTLSGSREGTVVVFKNGTYPFHAIGRVTFMWRPELECSNRTIWIWTHPAFYDEFLQELISVFQFKSNHNMDTDVEPVEENDKTSTKSEGKKNLQKKKDVERTKLLRKNIGKLQKLSNKNVTMVLLKDTLNRFRLTGPLAQVVLTEALTFVNIETFVKTESDKENKMDVDSKEKQRSDWLSDFYSNDSHMKSLKQQRLFWENLQNVNSADELPPRMIFPAVVMDPRLSMPSTCIKPFNTGVSAMQSVIPEGLCSHSPLWDEAMRNTATHSKMATAQLNNLRSQALVPGLAVPDWLGHQNVSHLPLLLVQNAGTRDGEYKGYGSGWDVIIPAAWAVPTWIGLVFRGARPGGLRETETLTLEMATGPTLPPDTRAGQEYSEQTRKNKEEKHFRLPPDKRPNYIKLGVVAPFHCPWQKLLHDWCPGDEDRRFYLIRNRAQLEFLKCLLIRTRSVVTCTFSENDKACGLVQVGVELCGRGTIGECSMICTYGKKHVTPTNKSGVGPLEPTHQDVNEERRKTKRTAHLALLKRLKKKRIRAKRELEEKGIFSEKTKCKTSPTENLVKNQAKLMKELWLPKLENVKNSSTSCVLGYVTCGGYSFTKSHPSGYGFVALSALLGVLQRNETSFLLRNVNSNQYYFAKLKLLNPTSN